MPLLNRLLIGAVVLFHVSPALAAEPASPAKEGGEGSPPLPVLERTSGGVIFRWDLQKDRAELRLQQADKPFWQGPLLPSFWLKDAAGDRQFIKAKAVGTTRESKVGQPPDDQHGELALVLEGKGRGLLCWEAAEAGIIFRRLEVQWDAKPPAVVAMYFGMAQLSAEEQVMVPTLERPFWPRWQADGYCIPSAKGSPIQSFFRRWDFGHANIPLGSFGPAMGTPYAAAYPRPLFSAAMGSNEGWVAMGPGAIPDAALTLQIRSSTAALEWLYREDLWPGDAQPRRVWQEPLRLFWAPRAWDAYARLFDSFGPFPAVRAIHQQGHWNSWGNFKRGQMNLRDLADRAADDFRSPILVLDAGWETSPSDGIPNHKTFPRFEEDLKYIQEKGLGVGFWQAIGWVREPEKLGLGPADLLCGADGRPRRVTWCMGLDSADASYCLDPASAPARAFLRERTQRVMKQYHPRLLKLDFGYGLPGPDVAASRDPAMRGERTTCSLMQAIVESAREIDPDVTIQYYGIHPLMRPVTDMVTLDDLGDAGGKEAAGHAQWSVWSALAGLQGTAINASSGYDWQSDAEILLDTAVIGAPGAILPLPPGKEPPATMSTWCPPGAIAHRQALARWHRRQVGWRPLWLNSEAGSLKSDPQLRCFGRLETDGGKQMLTALALRDEGKQSLSAKDLPGVHWQGRWAIISRDWKDIYTASTLACIPFDGGWLQLPRREKPSRVTAVFLDGQEPAADWKWKQGSLRLDVRPMDSARPLLGLLITTSER